MLSLLPECQLFYILRVNFHNKTCVAKVFCWEANEELHPRYSESGLVNTYILWYISILFQIYR